MAFDGMVARAIAIELNKTLAGGKIEKIYQPEKEELVFVVRSLGTRYKLYMSCAAANCGMHLSEEEYETPAQPSAFCMLLRKHMQGAVIKSITQKDCERILEISVEAFDELGDRVTKKLVAEIMGKHSNLLLVSGKDGTILDSVKRSSLDENKSRQVLPGFPYEYPDPQGKKPFDDVHTFPVTWFEGERDKDKALVAHIQGLSPLMAREIMVVESADLTDSPDSMITLLSQAETIFANMKENLATGNWQPAVYLKEDKTPAEFHVLPLATMEGRERVSFDTISAAVAYFNKNRDAGNRIRQKASAVTRATNQALKKARLKRQRLGEDLLEAQGGDTYRLYGELLTANLHLCKTGDKSVDVLNYYDNSTITIPLDVRFAPAKNAQNYYKKYSKSKRAIREKTLQIEETEQDIAYLESVMDLIERADSTGQLDAIKEELIDTGYIKRRKVKKGKAAKKAKDKPQPFTYKSTKGLDILAGRNNKENDFLTFKLAGKNDLWFHTKDIPGSHVILFVKGEVDDKSIVEAAQIAAFHSKAKGSENVPVDYTKVR